MAEETVIVKEEQDTNVIDLTKELDPSTDETKIDDETKVEGETKIGESKKDGEKKEKEITSSDEEVGQLRQLLREQKRQISILEGKVDISVDAEGNEIPSRIQELQDSLNTLAESREAQLELLVTSMSETEKYADVSSVCTDMRFGDIFDAVASELSDTEGIDFNEALLEVEKSVWSRANPYKYMYEIIKEYHPDFAKEEKEKEGEKKVLKAVDIPGSVGNISGTKIETSIDGWTATKIDNLPESELGSVPANIYSKYMKGELN